MATTYTDLKLDYSLASEAPNLDINKVRLIFLDIDGVINSTKTWLLAGRWPYPEYDDDYGVHYHGGGPVSRSLKAPYVSTIEAIDKYAVGLLNKLCVATNAHIVLSSTWRLNLDIYDIRKMLEAMGFDPLRVIGKTVESSGTRGEQIFNFCQAVGEKRFYSGPDFLVSNGRLIQSLSKVPMHLDSCVIIDDIEDGFEEEDFVKTNPEEGLTLNNVIRAGQILTGNGYFSLNHLVHGEDYQGSILHVSSLP